MMSSVTGIVEKSEDWHVIKVYPDKIKVNGKASTIYPMAGNSFEKK